LQLFKQLFLAICEEGGEMDPELHPEILFQCGGGDQFHSALSVAFELMLRPFEFVLDFGAREFFQTTAEGLDSFLPFGYVEIDVFEDLELLFRDLFLQVQGLLLETLVRVVEEFVDLFYERVRELFFVVLHHRLHDCSDLRSKAF
jgi:hypothetical protein